MKYLGLTLDGSWGFEQHFAALAPKVGRIAEALSRLLPNIGGPGVKTRRLYANTVLSVALYGSPVWAGEMAASARIQASMHRALQLAAIRVIRSYRTVSYTASTVLAGISPVEFLAEQYREAYNGLRDLRREGSFPPGAVDRMRRQARARAICSWEQFLGRVARVRISLGP
nr:PREDICTED: uncharacterized protein LOC105669916 [Linepithema humile]